MIGTVPPSGACSSATDCQSLTCVDGACGTACLSDGQACTADAACCGGKCDQGTCQALNATCKTGGNACAGSDECCSHLCQGGACVLGSSFCIQNGDACARATDCCSGTCTVPTGGTLGTCGAPPTGPSFCNGGVDGTVCGGCNDCCSRLCAPYGPTGVMVCQRANGCHIDGDLCRKDDDCCGGPNSMAPGAGNVTCESRPARPSASVAIPWGAIPRATFVTSKITRVRIRVRATTAAGRLAIQARASSTRSGCRVVTPSINASRQEAYVPSPATAAVARPVFRMPWAPSAA